MSKDISQKKELDRLKIDKQIKEAVFMLKRHFCVDRDAPLMWLKTNHPMFLDSMDRKKSPMTLIKEGKGDEVLEFLKNFLGHKL